MGFWKAELISPIYRARFTLDACKLHNLELFIAATHFIHGAVIPAYMLDAKRLGILLRRLAGNQILNVRATGKP